MTSMGLDKALATGTSWSNNMLTSSGGAWSELSMPLTARWSPDGLLGPATSLPDRQGGIACPQLSACAQPVLQAQAPLPQGPGNLSSTIPASRSPGGPPNLANIAAGEPPRNFSGERCFSALRDSGVRPG